MKVQLKPSSVRRRDRSVTSRQSDEIEDSDDVIDELIQNFARANRRIELPNADDVLVLATLRKINSRNMSVSRGEVVNEFTREGAQNVLPTSTTLASVAFCARIGLIESRIIESKTNRISGRPVQAVRPTIYGRMFLVKMAELIGILDAAMTSHKSEKLLN